MCFTCVLSLVSGFKFAMYQTITSFYNRVYTSSDRLPLYRSFEWPTVDFDLSLLLKIDQIVFIISGEESFVLLNVKLKKKEFQKQATYCIVIQALHSKLYVSLDLPR